MVFQTLPGFKFSHTHLKLAGLNDAVYQEFIDLPGIGCFECTGFGHVGIGKGNKPCGVGGMCRCRIDIEVCGFGRIGTC